jgi:hypothetical protein
MAPIFLAIERVGLQPKTVQVWPEQQHEQNRERNDLEPGAGAQAKNERFAIASGVRLKGGGQAV